MLLEENLKNQLKELLGSLKHELIISAKLDDDEHSNEAKGFLEEIVKLSPKISIEKGNFTRTPCFSIARKGEESRVEFAGLPLDHEFDSFILAVKQIDGFIPVIDEKINKRLAKLDRKVHFETYVSLSCHNCPEVVQSLNFLSIINPNISHTMVEGKMFYEERIKNNVLSVPSIFLDGQEVASGRKSIEQLLDIALGVNNIDEFLIKKTFDVLVIGGGPAGNSAAIYSVRKGLQVGMIAENYGGKVMDISGIENMIGIPYTEGPRLMSEVEIHLYQYYIDVMKNHRVKSIIKDDLFDVKLENDVVLKAKAIILAVGAVWEKLNIPGETEFFTKGVTNCPHCDGPLFSGKDVAIIGGGNQAIEGAIDLANKARYVYVLEQSSELKADKILQDRLTKLSNVTLLTNVDVKEIVGTDCVSGLSYINKATKHLCSIDLEGVFVQTKLIPNTDWLNDLAVILNEKGEIITDDYGMTNIPGLFAAGDCTNSVYKQIIISMGSGANAALGVFDYLIRQ